MSKRKKQISNPYLTFNRIILFTIEAYLTNACTGNAEALTDTHRKLISGIQSYMTFGRFTEAERLKVVAAGESEIIKLLKKEEVSFVVYAMELIRLWVEIVPQQYRNGIFLGVGNKKLKMGKAVYVTDMLHLKRTDKSQYDHFKEIINKSTINAKSFFYYMEQELVIK